ncbi:MAG: hypothetical protein WBA97_28850, partial [Actinophytocola sp.]
ALVRLRSRQPDGSVIGESRRTCHLVPVPESTTMPEFLVACCGLRIGPGQGEVLPEAMGMPCELCLSVAWEDGTAVDRRRTSTIRSARWVTARRSGAGGATSPNDDEERSTVDVDPNVQFPERCQRAADDVGHAGAGRDMADGMNPPTLDETTGWPVELDPSKGPEGVPFGRYRLCPDCVGSGLIRDVPCGRCGGVPYVDGFHPGHWCPVCLGRPLPGMSTATGVMSSKCRGMSWREEANDLISSRADGLGMRLVTLAGDALYDADDPGDVMSLAEDLAELVQLLVDRASKDQRYVRQQLRRELMGETTNWARIAEQLTMVATRYRRQAATRLTDVGDSGGR